MARAFGFSTSVLFGSSREPELIFFSRCSLKKASYRPPFLSRPFFRDETTRPRLARPPNEEAEKEQKTENKTIQRRCQDRDLRGRDSSSLKFSLFLSLYDRKYFTYVIVNKFERSILRILGGDFIFEIKRMDLS